MVHGTRSASWELFGIVGVGLFLSRGVGAQPVDVPAPAVEATRAEPSPSVTYAVKTPPSPSTRKPISPADRDLARSHAAAAFTSLDAGAYAEAADRFGQAIALFAVPTLLVGRADALVHLGRWKEAIVDYEAALAYELEPEDSESFAVSQTDAATKLSSLQERMPRLRIDSSTRLVTVTVDGLPFTSFDTTNILQLDPGPHTVVISALGQSLLHSVEAKEHELVSVEAPKPVPPSAPAMTVAPSPWKSPAAPSESADPSTEVLVSGALTGLMAVGAIITGVMYRSSDSKYREMDQDDDTPYEQLRSQYNQLKAIAAINTTLTAAAVTAAGVTAYFWVAPQFSDTSPAQANADVHTPALSGVALGVSSHF